MQRAGIKKTPPPTPSNPEIMPIEKPTIAHAIRSYMQAVKRLRSDRKKMCNINKEEINMVGEAETVT